MREKPHHNEESEHSETRSRREHGERSHHDEESKHSETRSHREHGERSHHNEESEHSETRSHREHGERSHHDEESEGRGQRDGSRRHRSWRSADEDEAKSRPRRERVERGMLRYLLLDALRHGPKHGYEMIKWLEDQTYGRYAPSAGTVYPTLQLLENQGLLLAERAGDKSVYRLTEMGTTELQTHADFTQDFWDRYGHPVPSASMLLASEFVYEELQSLQSTVEKGVHMLTQQADQQNLLPLRQVLERSKNEIRDLLAHNSVPQQISTGTNNAPVNANELEEAIAQVFVSEDEVLRQTLVRAREHGLPPIQISALQGKLLQVLAAACQARKILEIGSLAGYSGIWLARALPADGRLITLEINVDHAEVVRESFRHAGVDDRAEVRVGPALETLPLLSTEGPFDLIFIDADKDPYPQYLAWAIQLARPGSIIVADNCVRGGDGLPIHEENAASSRNAGIRTYNQNASTNPSLCSIALPINSGMTISVVLDKVVGG